MIPCNHNTNTLLMLMICLKFFKKPITVYNIYLNKLVQTIHLLLNNMYQYNNIFCITQRTSFQKYLNR